MQRPKSATTSHSQNTNAAIALATADLKDAKKTSSHCRRQRYDFYVCFVVIIGLYLFNQEAFTARSSSLFLAIVGDAAGSNGSLYSSTTSIGPKPKYTIAVVAAMSDDQVSKALTNEFQQDPLPLPRNNDATELDEHGQSNAWKSQLFGRLNRVRLLCGDLCTLNTKEEWEAWSIPNEVVPQLPTVIVPNVYCPNMLGMEHADAGDLTFPNPIPIELQTYYSLGGAVNFRWDQIRKDAYLGGESETKLWETGSVWKFGAIEQAIADIGTGTFKGSYGINETNMLRDALASRQPTHDTKGSNDASFSLKNKSILVIGSSHPWVEAICLYHGAAKVTTLEYGTIHSEHPKIVTETPDTFRAKYLDGTLEAFDGVVTHSSLEHSGLGRYGDALNPWGDILAVARAWCVTKPGGFLWLGIPTGWDLIFYNWHRVYGSYRWPLVVSNWKTIQSSGMNVNMPVAEKLTRGPWKSQDNEGFLFQKIG